MNTIKLGKPFTPSTILGTKSVALKRITMTCGGGMGGSRWSIYVKERAINLDKVSSNDFLELDTTDGKMIINTKYIVDIQSVNCFQMKVRNDGNRSCYGGVIGSVVDFNYILDDETSVVIAGDYPDDHNLTKIKIKNSFKF